MTDHKKNKNDSKTLDDDALELVMRDVLDGMAELVHATAFTPMQGDFEIVPSDQRPALAPANTSIRRLRRRPMCLVRSQPVHAPPHKRCAHAPRR